jgi:hypothetical protein
LKQPATDVRPALTRTPSKIRNRDTHWNGTTPPVITINGNNPAHIHVGETYNDLGATITAPAADLNLGIHTACGQHPDRAGSN